MIQNYGSNYLKHYGVKGMRWGVRKDSFSGPAAFIARRQNKKIDKSFERWKDSDAAKKDAIEKGKIANKSRLEYEKDKSNAELKAKYKQDQKEYKQALKKNTTYRKGSVKEEVISDLSRKHLSEAKMVKKKLDADPTNKELQKQFKEFSDAHDIERMQARRAQSVAANRSRMIASVKRAATITVKAAVATTAVSVGVKFANKYTNVSITSQDAYKYINLAKNSMRVINEVSRYF